MRNWIRSVATALAITSLAVGLASPSFARERLAEVADDPAAVPMIFDVAIMRPIGLMTLAIGTAFYVFPVAPLMAVTRPTEIFKPARPLIGGPARFTFVDPIGQHP